MILAIINGLITSIILETIILMKQDLDFSKAFKTAMGMSFISMISMEITMNLTDYLLTGGAILTWWVIPIMLLVDLTPWPYNYWRLKIWYCVSLKIGTIKLGFHLRDIFNLSIAFY